MAKNVISKARVVVVFVSEAYVHSTACVRELLCATAAGRFIIPVLLPPYQPPDLGPNCGWSGPPTRGRNGKYIPTSGEWWEHADTISRSKRDPDTGEPFSWGTLLSKFEWVDMRLADAMNPESKPFRTILRLALSRFQQEGMAAHMPHTKFPTWRRKKLLDGLDPSSEGFLDNLLDIFRALDIDASGQVTKEELSQALAGQGHKFDALTVSHLFKEVDLDNDASVSLQELKFIAENM